MKTIRILHLSDIHAGSGEFEKIQDELIKWIDPINKSYLDYLIICGNLVSSSANSSDYDRAGKILTELAEKVLVKDPVADKSILNETRLSRILITPGHHEFNDTAKRDDFIAFYRQFFREEYDKGRIVNFNANFMIYRDLKDFTVIGVPYFDSLDEKAQGALLSEFINLLHSDLAKSEIPEYSKHSPTLLLSAGNPVFNFNEDDYFKLKRIGEILDRKLSVKLHLFGGGAASGVLPELNFRHISLGTGFRQKDNFYPFRANLIEIDKSSQNNSDSLSPFIKVFVFQKRRAEHHPITTSHIEGELDLFFRQQKDTFDESKIYQMMSENITDAILNKDVFFIPINGLPGAGKTEYFNYLKDNPKILSDYNNLYILGCHVENYSQETIQAVLDEVSAAKDKYRSEDTILAINDQCFEKGDGITKMKVKEFIESLCNSLENEIRAVLYFIPNQDFIQGYEALLGRTKELSVEPLDLESTRLWAQSYSKDVPVIRYFYDLTGGYIGFSKLTLEASKELFKENFSGAERLSLQIENAILDDVLQDEMLRKKASALIESIMKMLGGPQFCGCIFENIKEKMSRREEIKDLRITDDQLKRVFSNENNTEIIIKILLDKLVDSKIIKKESFGAIKIRLVMPFLIYYKNYYKDLSDSDINTTKPVEEVQLDNAEIPGKGVDYLIITALPEEMEAVLRKLNGNINKISGQTRPYYCAEISVPGAGETQKTCRVVVTSVDGMGGSMAGVATLSALYLWQPRCVLLVGIAGGFEQAEVGIGDILLAEQIIGYDIEKLYVEEAIPRFKVYKPDARHLNFARAVRDFEKYIEVVRPEDGKIKRHVGDIFSGNKIDASGTIKKKYGHMWPKAIGIEMEAVGVAEAVRDRNIPFFMVRSTSDLADGEKDKANVKQWRDYACDAAAAFAIALIEDCIRPFIN